MSDKLSDAQLKAAEAKLRGKTVRDAIANLDVKEKATVKGVAIAAALMKKRYKFNPVTKTWK